MGCDATVNDEKIANFVPFIRGIDDTAVSNDRRAHVRGAQAASL